MSTQHEVNRRSVLAALGGLGLGLGMSAGALASPPTVELDGPRDPASGGTHQLVGLWLAMARLPTDPDTEVAIPGIFNQDGSVFLMFPPTETVGTAVQLKGAAIGTWEAVDPLTGHFTVVQSLCGGDGTYQGCLTIDGYISVALDGASFKERTHDTVLTIRDHRHEVTQVLGRAFDHGMTARRMTPGNAGFVDEPDRFDPRTPD